MKTQNILTIAASDPSGGAGIQADLNTFYEFGLSAQSIITGVTAQNNNQFIACEAVSETLFQQQLTAVFKEYPPTHIKIGALINENIVSLLIGFLSQCKATIICDPVIQSSSGGTLLSNTVLDLFKKGLIPLCDLLTPNIPETEILLNCKIHNNNDIQNAAAEFLKLGVKHILIKGGHADSELASDYFLNNEKSFWIYSRRIDSSLETSTFRGTGCILSSAITAALAKDEDIENAITIAKMHLNRCLRKSKQKNALQEVPRQNNLPDYQESDIPFIACVDEIASVASLPRKVLNNISLPGSLLSIPGTINTGLYAIVDSFEWVKLCVRHQVKLIQLRIKQGKPQQIETEIKKSIDYCKKNNVQLIINDYWKLAIKFQAFGVHLGQDDLNNADIEKIKKNNIKMGISTHCYFEIAKALHYQPDYLAFGPIFKTESKKMTFTPRGLEQLLFWRNVFNKKFMVAIGGINLDNIDAVLKTGVNSVALISAISKADKPYKAIQQLTAKCHTYLKSPILTERYIRQMALPIIGISGQAKIKNAKILIIGAGGLGCPALLYLAAAGVGEIGIMDGDTVEESNLGRQILFFPVDLTKKKALIAAEKCQAQNPHVKIIAYDFFLNKENASLIKNYDVILDCSDNFDTRYLINDTCLHFKKPLIFAAVNQTQGMLAVFTHEMNLRDIFPNEQNHPLPNCSQAGILGTTTGIIGAMQAQEAIKVILTCPKNIFISIDTLNHRYKTIATQCDFPKKTSVFQT